MRQLTITQRDWPVRGTFRISRSALTVIPVVEVSLQEGEQTGRGECRPYARYGYTPENVIQALEAARPLIENGADRQTLARRLPAGPVLNALDCALWDLEAKQAGKRVWDLAGLPAPSPQETAYTLSIDSPDAMASAAKAARDHALLKMKLDGEHVIERVTAVCDTRPDARLILDANEGFDAARFERLYAALSPFPIALIEQPLLADHTDILPIGAIPICADEGLHTADDLPHLHALGYRAVNVKLDKCGGLTGAIRLMREAQEQGFTVMAGCMVGSSLAIAPMMAASRLADILDLDGALLLAGDQDHAMACRNGRLDPPSAALWG